ncbi:DUF6607 family protein [Flavobacterium cerinum]|uniref:Uncharacterized protein n=1 Tax=Flavobacterium cerinum TaxID=2502784 RepID=A0ABY5IVZ1_9FLAO|nr:DUF6607 family protein [Flavobacterium cerinum]UUC47003.1 hypothetical protein NOX80_07320 [Flavobacterium cerinum]
MKNLKQKVTVALLFAAFLGHAQGNKKKQDIDAIKSMCGCYEVEFNFAETFKTTKDENYKPSPTKYDKGLEWVELVEDKPNKIVMQHLLIVGDTMIVKHWRQDWEFENTRLYDFFKDTTWKYKTLSKADVKGQWTQRVFQVDDSPRYEGTATWVHVDGTSYWRNYTDAPLPRREHTIRNDYNVLNRRNEHEITKFGWIHNQDNKKIQRDNSGKDVVLAQEKGIDIYTKVADSKCATAHKYWKENKAMWKNVRDKWQTIFDRNKDLNLEEKVNRKSLFGYLFDLKGDTPKAETDKIIDSFVKN